MLVLPNKKFLFLKPENIVSISYPQIEFDKDINKDVIQFEVLSEFSGKFYRQELIYAFDKFDNPESRAIEDYETLINSIK